MELLKEDPACEVEYPELVDSGPTIAFIRRMAGLISAMTSRGTATALYQDDACESKKVAFRIINFLNKFVPMISIFSRKI